MYLMEGKWANQAEHNLFQGNPIYSYQKQLPVDNNTNNINNDNDNDNNINNNNINGKKNNDEMELIDIFGETQLETPAENTDPLTNL